MRELQVVIGSNELAELITKEKLGEPLVCNATQYETGSYWPVNFIVDGGELTPRTWRHDYVDPTGKNICETLIAQGTAYKNESEARGCMKAMLEAAYKFKESLEN